MKRNPQKDKALRLYTRLSDVDGDLILDSTIPVHTPPAVVRHPRWEAFKSYFSRPWAASVAASAVLLALVIAALVAAGLTDDPTTTPSPHGSTPSEQSPVAENPVAPTMENAAALRKGMSFAELVALMGSGYTADGDGSSYTFTLDTGEALTVSVAPNGEGETTVTGFTWLGGTAEEVNPLALPSDILQMMQTYATDKVIPVYTMTSFISAYGKLIRPAIEKVLEDAELHYLCMSEDGETALLNEEGHGMGGNSLNRDYYSLLDNAPALFDESVRIKTYYPILTSQELWAVYFSTSVGDYILYLHGEGLSSVAEGEETADDPVPYLMPVAAFHSFARGVVNDQTSNHGVEWLFSTSRMEAIEPYRIDGEGYAKPVNLATPEAAARVEVGMETDFSGLSLIQLLGNGLATADQRSAGLYYWELTDGRGLIVSTKITESYSGRSPVYEVSVVLYTDSADVLYEIGTLSTATVSLLRKDMSLGAVNAMLSNVYSTYTSNDFIWNEDGLVYTCACAWNEYQTGGTVPTTEYTLDTYTLSTRSVAKTLEEIQVGVSFADVVARLGDCRDGHEVDYFGGTGLQGYHFWALPNGRYLAAYIGYDIPEQTDPYGINMEYHFNMSVMHLLWLDSAAEIEAIGTPSLSHAELVETGMKEVLVKTLMGDPTVHVENLFSVWEWEEAGKTRYLTVYWKENTPVGLHQNFLTVADCTVSDTPVETPADKTPSEADAAAVTLGMTAKELLLLMGSQTKVSVSVDAALYIWTLPDGRAFCVLTEGDQEHADQPLRVVTRVFYRNSYDEVFETSPEQLEEIQVGMSLATVYALLGSDPCKISYTESTTWSTTVGAWWDIVVEWELREHPETGLKRVYASSVTIQ